MIYDYVNVMKIFIFGLVIAFFIFKIGYWSKAYSDSHADVGCVELSSEKISTSSMTHKECLDVLRYGNIMPQNFQTNDDDLDVIHGDFQYRIDRRRFKEWTKEYGDAFTGFRYICLYKRKIQMCTKY